MPHSSFDIHFSHGKFAAFSCTNLPEGDDTALPPPRLLPAHLQSGFDTLFGPRLREAFGYTKAWEQPCDDELSKLRLAAFPRELPFDFGMQEGWVVKKLVCDHSFIYAILN